MFGLITNKPVYAGTCTWTGVASSNWNDSGNWSGVCSGVAGVAGDTDDLIFPEAAGNMTMNNDLGSLSPASMTFQSSSYILNGNSLLLGGDIFTEMYQPTISTDLDLQTDLQLQTAIYNGNIDLNSHTLTFTSSDPRIEVHGVISGTGNLIVQGGYLVNLYAANTFSGNITLQDFGSLNLLHNNALGNAANTVLVNGNCYLSMDGGVTVTHAVTLQEQGAIVGYGTNNILSGEITGPNDSIFYVYVGGTDSLTLSGKITGFMMALGSNGNLILSGSTANDLDNLLIQSGTVTLAKTSSTIAVSDYIRVGQGVGDDPIYLKQNTSQQIGDSAQITVESDGVWELNGNNEQIATIQVNSGLVDSEDGDLNVNEILMTEGEIDTGLGVLNLTGDVTVDVGDGPFSVITGAQLNLNALSNTFQVEEGDVGALNIAAPIYGSGDITIFGVLVAFSGDNSNFSGTIYVGDADTSGILGIQHQNALGSVGEETVVAAGSSLFLDGDSGTIDETIEISGDGIGEVMGQDIGAIHAANSVFNDLAGNINLINDARITTGNDGALVISGVIAGDFDLTIEGINQPGLGVALTGINTYTGITTVIDNGLYLFNGDAIAGYGAVALSGDALLHLEDTETLGAVSGEGTIYIDDDAYWISAYLGGSSTFSGEITGAGYIIKFGAGELILSGNSPDYAGIFFNSEGTVTVDGSIGGEHHIQGGTWAGNGTMGTAVAENGQISPGSIGDPGILNFDGGLYMNSLDLVSIQLNGTTLGGGYDQINVDGDVSINDAALNLSAAVIPTDGITYTILNASGSITGEFVGLDNMSSVTVAGKEMFITYTDHTVELIAPAELYLENFSAAPDTTTYGNPVVLNVTWDGSGPNPDGTTSFLQGATVLATKSLNDSGYAKLTLNNLAVGTHTFSVRYNGDDIYGQAISAPITITITQEVQSSGEVNGANTQQITPTVTPTPTVLISVTPAPIVETNFSLKVEVYDENGLPQADALVSIQPGSLSGYTNQFGQFTFFGLAAGEYEINVEYQGKTSQQIVNIYDDHVARLDLKIAQQEDKAINWASIVLIISGVGLTLWWIIKSSSNQVHTRHR